MGQAPADTVLIEILEDVARVELSAEQKGVVLTQTTLSQDDTREIVAALLARYRTWSCRRATTSATRRRPAERGERGDRGAGRAAGGRVGEFVELIAADGSRRMRGVAAHLIDRAEISSGVAEGKRRVG